MADGAATIASSFAGTDLTTAEALTGSAFAPPDTDGAIGLNHYVEFINGAFSVYNRDGTLAAPRISDQTFWTNAGLSVSGLSDTRILYDTVSQRWFAAELTTAERINNHLLLARSDTSDPTGAWKAVSLNAATGRFADYTQLGLDANGVYLTSNNFNSFGSFTGVSVYSIPKADLLAATPSTARLSRFNDLSGAFALQPVVDYANAKGAAPFYSAVPNSAGSTSLVTGRLSGSGAAGASLAPLGSATVPTWSTSPNYAPQPDGTFQLDNLDGRFQSAGYQIGNDVWLVNSVDAGSADNHRAGLRWYHINYTTNALVASGLIADPSYDFFNAAIAANAHGDVVIGYTRSGVAGTAPGGNASAMALAGATSGTTTTFGSPRTDAVMMQQGLAGNYHLFGGAGERWGDFSAVSVDPTDPFTFWVIQEYAKAGGGSSSVWANWVTAISVPHPLIAGDANEDGKVNFADYQALEAHFGMLSGAVWTDGDFDGDGEVLFDDYQILEAHFGQQQIPEPAALSLLSLGGLAWACLRRRQSHYQAQRILS
jgi:hypothetical protein